MRVAVVTPPEPFVSLADACEHLKVDGGADDALIEGMVAAVCEHLDGPGGDLNHSLGEQVLEVRFALLDGPVALPFGPVLGVLEVEYLDFAGVRRPVNLLDVLVDGDEIAPAGSGWPWEGGSLRPDAVRVRYRAGYDQPPARAVQAAKLMLTDLYRYRGTVTEGTVSTVASSASVAVLLERLRRYR